MKKNLIISHFKITIMSAIKQDLPMETIKKHFNAIFGEDKWVISGSFAIYMLSTMLGIEHRDELEPNNIDIMYCHNTPIAASSFLGYSRIQKSPSRSVTFVSNEYKDINATMIRGNIRFFRYNHMNIITPTSLISWYKDALIDDPSNQLLQQKIRIITKMISLFSDDIIVNNTREPTHLSRPSGLSNEPLAKRLKF